MYSWNKKTRQQIEELECDFSLHNLKMFVMKNHNFFDIYSGLDFVEYLNNCLDNNHLKLYKLTPLMVFEDRLLYVDSQSLICLIMVNQISIRKILKELNDNIQTDEQIDFRLLLLELGKGEIKAKEVLESTKWFEDIKKNMLNERIIAIQKLSRIINNNSKLNKGIYLMRGATAVGKTKFVRHILLKPLKEEEISFNKAIISTDEIKKEFVRLMKRISGKEISGYVFHSISSDLSRKLCSVAITEELSFVIDTRLNKVEDLTSIYKVSKKQKMPITIYDIQGDFITSSLRVLRRTSPLYDDPTPDFEYLRKSFLGIQNSQKDILEFALANEDITYYHVIVKNNSNYIIDELKCMCSKLTKVTDPIVNEKVYLSSGNTLKQALDQHSKRLYINFCNKNQYFSTMTRNIHDTTRSIKGVINTSSSHEKKSRIHIGDNVENVIAENLQTGFEFIYNNRFLEINSEILSDFIIELANIVNKGIVKGNVFRENDSQKYNYLQAKYIPQFYKEFIDMLVQMLFDRTISPLYIAAFVEWNIDFIGHFFIDGCGRIAKLVSAWVLIRHNYSLPDYSIRQDDFKSIRSSYRKRFTPREPIDYCIPKNNDEWNLFYQYYKTLFLLNIAEQRIVASGGLIINEKDEVLLLQTSKGKDREKWLFPGGKLEYAESPEDAFIRECYEETGLIISEIALINERKYTARSGNEYLFYDFKTKIRKPIVNINNESLDYKWVKKEDLSTYDLTDSANNMICNNLEFYPVPSNNFKLKTIHIEEVNDRLHTMSEKLDDYICQKLPVDKLKTYTEINLIEIYGIYPDIKILGNIKFDFKIEDIIFQSKPKDNNSNSLRPLFCEARRGTNRFIVCFVVPGNDLIEHYASMLKYFYRNLNNMKVKIYDDEETRCGIGTWTGLDKSFIQKNDIVILGYSTFAKEYFSSSDGFKKISEVQNAFYTSTTFEEKNGKRVNCLEANYGHWGDISKHLVHNICVCDASEIIHIGKSGTFTDPNDVFSRLFIPNNFSISNGKIIDKKIEIHNNMSSIKEHQSGGHVSTSTVMNETFEQRQNLIKFGTDTIDIESSKIAQAVSEFNHDNNTSIKFSSIQFASDYIRGDLQKDEVGKVDLTTEREQLIYLKKNILLKIMDLIANHIIKNLEKL